MEWVWWTCLWFGTAIPIVTFSFPEKTGASGTIGAIVVLRFILTLIVSCTLMLICIPSAVMWWLWIGWTVFWTTLEIIAFEIRASIKWAFAIFLIAIITAGIVVGCFASYRNAMYFNSFIQKKEGFPIENEIPDDLLRLTTEELARTITAQYMAEFGGAMKIVDMQVTMYKERLVWVAVVARQEAWGATYKTEGLIIIDANDPDKKPEILRESFAVAQGLDFNPLIRAFGSAKAKGYYSVDTAITIGDTYPVFTPEGKWMMAMTSYVIDLEGVRHYNGIYLVDKDGNIVEHYKEVPEWLIQPFDEDTFLEGGISDWGAYKRGEGFDFFAGGFLWIPPSSDRLEISEDTRYIYDPDTKQVVALVAVHPIRERGELSLAGVFKVTSKGIFYYDLKEYNLMSGKAASGIVQSKIVARAGTEYFTAMELIYPLRVRNETKYVWFVPVYFKNLQTGQIGLAALGLVDAQAGDKVIIEYTGEGITGPVLIKKAKESFRALYEGKIIPETRQITGKLSMKYEPYVEGGNTRQWITIETLQGEKLDLLLKAEILSDLDWLKVQKLEIGQEVTLEIDINNVVKKVLS